MTNRAIGVRPESCILGNFLVCLRSQNVAAGDDAGGNGSSG